MARLSGIELQDNWRVEYALTKLKGIGWSLAGEIIDDLSITKDKRIKDLSNEDLNKIAGRIDDIPTEGDLARLVKGNTQRLVQTGSYRGIRHQRGLPVRGQRTKTNARTKRGKRKTVGAFRKEMLSKQTQSSDK